MSVWLGLPPFMQNALIGGTFIALASGLVGYFLVIRSQVFVGEALSHVAFTGALAALAIGVDIRVGLFIATIGAGVLTAAIGGRGRADDVIIGAVLAFVLGVGVLMLAYFTTTRSTANSTAAVRALFGSIYGLDASAVMLAAAVGIAISVCMLVIARPLLFSSLDPVVASALGVPVAGLGMGFLAIAGACAAEASQAVGSLLLVGLLATPGGAAQCLTARPYLGLFLSAAIAVGSMWAGLFLAYVIPSLPPSFTITAIVALCYALAAGTAVLRDRRGRVKLPAWPTAHAALGSEHQHIG